MIETYLLEQFAAFARCGTLLKASEELHITQPTLSRSMKKLEEELGVSIFHRENSKLSLNETGKVAAEYAEKALQANQDLIDHVLAYDRSLRTVSIVGEHHDPACKSQTVTVTKPDVPAAPAPAGKPHAPKTGDPSHAAAVLFLMMSAAAVSAGFAWRRE